MDDQEPSQEAILTAVAEYHQVSLSELSNRLETDFGRLFREVEALLEAGELVRANRFTYRLAEETPTDEPGPAEAVEHTPEGAGPDRPEAESSPATDEARRTVAVDDARASAPSTRHDAAAGRLALLGVVAIALGALGLYPVLVGERNGVLTAEAVTGLVDDRPPELAAGGAAGLVVLGGLSVLGGWVIAVGRSGQLARS